ncbi:putative undecaprenyldiphospho-muramoylpentapeptide beta-N-acetylglucosaminyltransferase [Bacteriovorax sp. BSW11_IV]|uniref:UDP-N-acetylglucosamine--N-acetylmuramyl- (pentapeptide) pyrophosphoryl-undecaprenol N-acetylglucosamine transferase n=1 Tax=Bacteriovorax sp. BSW11_IV TaxID=1353529 RepID=UPI00038A4DD8|nr:UDP-N-acetylglucosamine--N-acetylmuramyl-(pentapeptide) pyrophosphoryl-undecaprenol N-acetylglucosamine transferase [Bacteriovorax sp. BSW11_IV]EQC49592.1 putative undecaprenyldiphospho-muramoylpentapeptide beta-N-acetylglucosaminyltransferase [Bacteriovorax sp. BSW11_IV]
MKKKLKNIIFTGGGSGGHVIPGLSIIAELKRRDSNYNFIYIGGKKSIESQIVPSKVNLYLPISTGKLRRYLSVENFKDMFRIFKGLFDSLGILIKYSSKETVIFSTGGFVSVPVVIASWLTRKQVFIHEQTTRMGLANKICSYFAKKVFVSFEESLQFVSHNAIYSGYPVRSECFDSTIRHQKFGHFDLTNLDAPLLFITGGGNGSKLVNDKVKGELDNLKKDFVIIHQVGKDFEEEYRKFNDERYYASAFVGEEMIDLFKSAKVVLSRAGAGTVCELMALKKASIYVPLKIAQKNEQYHNAMAANRACGSIVLTEDEFKTCDLVSVIRDFSQVNSGDKGFEGVKDGLSFLADQIEQAIQ